MTHLYAPKYRPDIDGLRAIAVLSVVAFHAFPRWVKGGFIGVDVFFVISGFLISTIIFENLEKRAFSFSEFYARRIRRIFPALLVVLLATYAFGWFALLADEYMQLGKHIAGGAGFVSNIVLWKEAGYFDKSAETKILLHLWSLGIEEQFYIVWPLLIWIVWKCNLNPVTVTVTLAVASFSINARGVSHDAVAAFYSPMMRFWELLSGSLLAWLHLHRKASWRAVWLRIDLCLTNLLYRRPSVNDGTTLASVASFVGLSLLGYGFLKITKNTAFPGVWALVPVIGAMLVIVAGPAAWVNRKVLSCKIVVWFGLISFPLYLWHWPLLSFAQVMVGETPSVRIRAGLVLASIVLSWLTFALIEKRIRSRGRTWAVVMLVLLMPVIGGVGYATFSQKGLDQRAAVKKNAQAYSQLTNWSYSENETCIRKQPPGYELFCIQSKESPPTLMIVGNSYGNHLYAGLATNKQLDGNSVLSYGTCDPTKMFGDCKRQIDIIKKSPTVKHVIISHQWLGFDSSGRLLNQYGSEVGSTKASREDYVRGLHETIEDIEQLGVQVIVIGPKPEVDVDVASCIGRPLVNKSKPCKAARKDVIRTQASSVDLITRALEKHPRAKYFDQDIVFSAGKDYSIIRDGMPLLRDRGHYSIYGSSLFAEAFVKWSLENVPSLVAAD